MRDKYCPLIDDYCVGNCMFRYCGKCVIAEGAAAVCSLAAMQEATMFECTEE